MSTLHKLFFLPWLTSTNTNKYIIVSRVLTLKVVLFVLKLNTLDIIMESSVLHARDGSVSIICTLGVVVSSSGHTRSLYYEQNHEQYRGTIVSQNKPTFAL